jgi:D-3-phosphoglycerate dehydrogenase / 2-oxoglutarate reductase
VRGRTKILQPELFIDKEECHMPKVLISDKLAPAAVEIFRKRGIEADVETDLTPQELLGVIGEYDGLAVRSATKVTPDVIEAGQKLKVVGRAGIGVDNISVPAATARGIVVMNTPYGNSITTAEHAIALMLALVRQIPQANESTQAGKWEKTRFMGTELYGKTLGIIGCGNIGAIAADRALGLKMKVAAYDPFLPEARAVELGVDKVELDELFALADIISLHTPLTEQTRNIISAGALEKMKPGAYIVNCARGGLVDEAALREALDSGKVAGAAFDVFSEEPARENVLFGARNFIATPHLGASTLEAQENVALQVAEQMADYLLTGAVTNALNMPSISAEEAPRLKPWVALAEQLGLFLGQITERAITEVRVEFEGGVAQMNTQALMSAALAGLLKPQLQDVNMVSAPVLVKQRGIRLSEVKRGKEGIYDSYMRVVSVSNGDVYSVAGTIYSTGARRIIDIRGIPTDAELGPHMLYITNEDKPGFIGALGNLLGKADMNIATFHLGRDKPGGRAIALIEVDKGLDPATLKQVRSLPLVRHAHALTF